MDHSRKSECIHVTDYLGVLKTGMESNLVYQFSDLDLLAKHV